MHFIVSAQKCFDVILDDVVQLCQPSHNHWPPAFVMCATVVWCKNENVEISWWPIKMHFLCDTVANLSWCSCQHKWMCWHIGHWNFLRAAFCHICQLNWCIFPWIKLHGSQFFGNNDSSHSAIDESWKSPCSSFGQALAHCSFVFVFVRSDGQTHANTFSCRSCMQCVSIIKIVVSIDFLCTILFDIWKMQKAFMVLIWGNLGLDRSESLKRFPETKCDVIFSISWSFDKWLIQVLADCKPKNSTKIAWHNFPSHSSHDNDSLLRWGIEEATTPAKSTREASLLARNFADASPKQRNSQAKSSAFTPLPIKPITMDHHPQQDTFGRLSAQDKLMMESPSSSPAPKVRNRPHTCRRSRPRSTSTRFGSIVVNGRTRSTPIFRSAALKMFLTLTCSVLCLQEQTVEQDSVQRPRAGSIQQQQNDLSGEFLKRIQLPKKIDW